MPVGLIVDCWGWLWVVFVLGLLVLCLVVCWVAYGLIWVLVLFVFVITTRLVVLFCGWLFV